MLDTLSIISLCLFASFVLSELFFKIKYPRVIGQILAGVLLGLPAFRILFTDTSLRDIDFLAELGIVFLLLLTGMEINLNKFARVGRDVFMIAFFCVLFPFIFGFLLMIVLGYSYLVAFVVGAALSLTAEGTKLKTLIDMKVLNTKVGVIMLGAGMLDDLFELLFLSALIVISESSIASVLWIPVKLVVFVIMVYLAYRFLPMLIRYVHNERSRIAEFSAILIFALFVAVFSTQLSLGPIIGAFVAGIMIHLAERHKYEYFETVKELRLVTFSIVVPFFFLSIGLHFDVTQVPAHWFVILLVLLMATAGKLLGAIVATPFTDLTYKQTHLIGWGMNARGATELVIAELARSSGLIPNEIYVALIVMTIVTTLVFPLMIKRILHHNREILAG